MTITTFSLRQSLTDVTQQGKRVHRYDSPKRRRYSIYTYTIIHTWGTNNSENSYI